MGEQLVSNPPDTKFSLKYDNYNTAKSSLRRITYAKTKDFAKRF